MSIDQVSRSKLEPKGKWRTGNCTRIGSQARMFVLYIVGTKDLLRRFGLEYGPTPTIQNTKYINPLSAKE